MQDGLHYSSAVIPSQREAFMNRFRKIFIQIIKLSIAGILIFWLSHSGKLDLKQLAQLATWPGLLVSLFAYWLIFASSLGAMRWMLLLKGAGYQISYLQTWRLQLIGFFFNAAMPGAVGGDLVKVVYVIKQNPQMGKTPAMMSILLDRIAGLSGLFAMGLITALLGIQTIMASKALASSFYLVVILSLLLAIFFTASLWHYRTRDPFSQLFKRKLPGFSSLSKIYESLRVYRYKRKYILACILISASIQFSGLLMFYILTLKLEDASQVKLSSLASVFPLGILTTSVPLAPGGLGVGHVAFERLYNLIGLTQGANVFNLFAISQLGFNLLGIFPYFRMKTESNTKTEIHYQQVKQELPK